MPANFEDCAAVMNLWVLLESSTKSASSLLVEVIFG